MAVDEYLFLCLGPEAQTFLRFYQWTIPTVSIGYSQNAARVVDIDFCRRNDIDVVRRITGGKLVLHHREITYSICSSDKKRFSGSLAESYKRISQALIDGLSRMGLQNINLACSASSDYSKSDLPCFSYPARDEIEAEGKKIVGSAQKRIGDKFLQHGSIPLEKDDELLHKVTGTKNSQETSRMTSISEALGKTVSFEWAVGHLAAGISEFFGVSLKRKTFQPEEDIIIQKIRREKYENDSWTLHRRAAKNVDFFVLK